jgi:hypothetical protein
MTEVRVIVVPSSVSPGTQGPATGEIAISFNDIVFPLPGWNDFIVVVLEAWASALLRLLRGTSRSERVHFMEGPYAVDISRVEGGAFRVCAIERPNRERFCVDVRPVSLVESVATAAEAVLLVCRQAGLWSPDAEGLEGALPGLREEVRTLMS